LNKPVLSIQPATGIVVGQLEFDDSTKTLYGLYYNGNALTMNFVSINEVTGAVNIINQVPITAFATGVYTYNQADHQYMSFGVNTNGQYIFCIDALTGQIVNTIPFGSGSGINNIKFDNTTGTLYGTGNGRLMQIDRSTGNITVLTTTSDIQYMSAYPSYTTYDEIHHRYIAGGTNNSGIMRLISLDMNTYQTLSRPVFPTGINPGENVVELKYNNHSGILYALHWGTEPILALNMQGSLATCHGTCNGTASAAPLNGTGPYTYHWQTGQDTSYISNLCSGTYYVTVTDSAGRVAIDSVVLPGVSSISVTAHAEQSQFCNNDSAHLWATPGFSSYTWSNGAPGQYTFTNLPGEYWVTATDVSGCTAESNHITVSNYGTPSISVVQSGDTLICYSAGSYQWYLDGQPIAGATGNRIVATQPGIYTVLLTDNNGCSALSSPMNITTAITDPEGVSQKVHVFPNPSSSGTWHIIASEDIIGSVCKIFDSEARLVYKCTLHNTETEINASGLPAGAYLLQVQSKTFNYGIRLLRLEK
jgi:hypothetical protein